MTAMDLTPAEIDLERLFRPQAFRRFQDVLSRATPMVHYTSAEAAISIINNRRIWLRNSAFMNDASEINYAIGLLEITSTTTIPRAFRSGRPLTN